LAILVICELTLQVRSQIKTGHSILVTFFLESPNYLDASLGSRRLKPNQLIEGKEATIRTNSLGFRGDEISAEPVAGELRVAVLGASTVFGAYARNNSATFPARLEHLLRERLPDRPVHVINAGLVGLVPEQQRKLLEKEVLPLSPSWVVWYPGMNNLTEICRTGSTEPPVQRTRRAAPGLSLPNWALTYELVRKNTVWLRPSPPPVQRASTSTSQSPGEARADEVLLKYERAAKQIATAAAQQGARVLYVGNTRSFRREMPLAEQIRLSESMRHYYPCLDVDSIHKIGDRINAVLARTASNGGGRYLEGSAVVPGGEAYFADASHFSAIGEQKMAEGILKVLVATGALSPDSGVGNN
jgi:lysophospholipase L1-like esterase